jgi:hypothetical protein
MTKQIRLIIMGKDANSVALVELTTVDFRTCARAVVEQHEPPLYYDTPFHHDERTALADVAMWLRSRCDGSVTRPAADGGTVVVISGERTLPVASGDAPRVLRRAG